MKFVACLMSFCLVMSCSVNASALKVPVKQTNKVIKLVAFDTNGVGVIAASGFPIDKTRIITAGHFCEAVTVGLALGSLVPDIELTYRNANNEVANMRGAFVKDYVFDDTLDICVIERPKHGLPFAKMQKDYSKTKIGDKVYVVGSPVGIFQTITEGLVAEVKTEGMPVPMLNNKLLISAPSFGGNSGGAVMNEKGEIIGILVAGFSSYHHISFAVTIEDVWKYLEKLKLDGK